jgi:hypothetical protein
MEHGHDEILHVTIGTWHYDAVRVTDDSGAGYIELREQGGGAPVARITYHGPDVGMDVTTYGAALPRPVVEWLLDRADWGLA